MDALSFVSSVLFYSLVISEKDFEKGAALLKNFFRGIGEIKTTGRACAVPSETPPLRVKSLRPDGVRPIEFGCE